MHHPSHHRPTKKGNSLSVRLTESAVFLRADATPPRRNHHADNVRTSMLRGLLVLDLVKPTKITSIEVELIATTSTAWPEGIGARRIDVTETHTVFNATTTYFRAGKDKDVRRATSIGPGVSYSQQYYHDLNEYRSGPNDMEDDFEETDWLRGRVRRLEPSTVTAPARSRTTSRDASRSNSGREISQPQSARSSSHYQRPPPSPPDHYHQDGSSYFPPSPPASRSVSTSQPSHTQSRARPNRHTSVDGSQFHRVPVQDAYPEEILTQLQLPPIPPYSAYPISSPLTPASPDLLSSIQLSPGYDGSIPPQWPAAQTLEEHRNSLHWSLENSYRYQSQSTGSTLSQPFTQHEGPLSRHPSLLDVLEFQEPQELATPRSQTPSLNQRSNESPTQSQGNPALHPPPVATTSRPSSRPASRPGSHSRPPSLATSRSPALSPVDASNSAHASSGSHVAPDHHNHPPSPSNERGRKGSRFSFQAVSNILLDAVRSSSPMNIRSGGSGSNAKVDASRERSNGVDRDRERSMNPTASGSVRGRRGRTMERAFTDGHEVAETETSVRFEEGSRSRVRASKERGGIGVIEKLLKDGKEKEKEKDKEHHNGWKEFKKGTYTYPISFSIPANAPPSMQCDYGSVQWRLKATVHRPGAFKPRMEASREVTMITCPTEEDTEDTENIIVERHWEHQLQYLITISGRSFYIGGTVPVTFTLLPLAKAKIHRLSVFIEERVEYYTNMRRVARSDPLSRFNLLTVKAEGKSAEPILPLESDCPDALRNSPLVALIDPLADDAELSEIASSLMGPGPWTFHRDLKLPSSCDSLKFTNKNKRSNIVVSHVLKVVMRVERGDDMYLDPKTGKRKLFDIVVQTPILILSCRCNPEWTSLPRYVEVFDDSTTITPICPCQMARNKARAEHGHSGFVATLERVTSRHSSASSSASSAETNAVNPNSMWSLRHLGHNESLVHSNDLYERLISGRESESGEAPPAYNLVSSPQTRSPACA